MRCNHKTLTALLLHLLAFAAPALLLEVCTAAGSEPSAWTFEVVAKYDHDPGAFTQGLAFDRLCNDTCKQCYDVFWESTGLNGRSSVRLVDVTTGKVQRKTDVPSQHFAEGLVRLGDKLYQLTWRSGVGFVYSVPDLKQVGTFDTGLGDGWGLTTDGTYLIATESSPTVHFLDPTTFKKIRSFVVTDDGQPLQWLNELEVVDGELWANVWQTECIARVDMMTGKVTGWILMHGLREGLVRSDPVHGPRMDVLNGIAWDPASKRLFVTGKLWPALYEVKVKPHPKPPNYANIKRRCWPR